MVEIIAQTEGAVFTVHAGRQRGIFTTWREALKQIKDFPGAVYKKHGSRAEAEVWLNEYAAKDAAVSALSNAPPAPAVHAPLLNALDLDLNAGASSERRANGAIEATASVDIDDGIPGVREAEELLRRARIKEAAKGKAGLGSAAAVRKDSSTSVVGNEAVRVKEETVEIDVKTWTSSIVEQDVTREGRQYTSSEKQKWRAGTSRVPVADPPPAVPDLDIPRPERHSQKPSSSAGPTETKPEGKPAPAAHSMPPAVPTTTPPRQTQASSTHLSTTTKSTSTPVKTTSESAAVVAPIIRTTANEHATPVVSGPDIIVYTDGAAPDNQSKELRVAGYGIYWAAGRPDSVIGDISRRCANGRTNNYAELLAIIRALEYTISDSRPLAILSDSKYSINCFGWINGWRDRGWKTSKNEDVKNVDMIRYMVALRALRAGPTTLRHVPAHTSKRGVPDTVDQRGNKIADTLAVAGAKLPESAAEKDTDEDWAKARASAEKRLEEREKKQENETVQVNVGSALGLTQAPAADASVAATAQAISQMTLTEDKQETATNTGDSVRASQWKKGKLARSAILAAMEASPQPESSNSTTAAQTPNKASQSSDTHARAHDPATSTGVRSASAGTATSSGPQTPIRPTAHTGGHTSAQTNHAHTTPVAAAPARPGGKVIVRVIDPDEDGYDDGIWDEEDTLDDAAMIAEALGR